MRFTTYSKYKGKWLDALNLESLLELMRAFVPPARAPWREA